jgi:hypothetical protein
LAERYAFELRSATPTLAPIYLSRQQVVMSSLILAACASYAGQGAPRFEDPMQQSLATMPKALSPELTVARDAFVAALKRDVAGAEQARMIAVLDALLRWSASRSTTLALRAEGRSGNVLAFERVGSRTTVWSARVTQGEGARLELLPPAGRSLSPEDRAMVLDGINAHSRSALVDGDPLRISFAALKNTTAREAVLALLDRLLVPSAPIGAA